MTNDEDTRPPLSTFGIGKLFTHSLITSLLIPTLPIPALPIFDLEASIVASLQKHARLILQAPTGSGKSTQVPQIVLDHGLAGQGEIVVLQPRRLATRMLSARVAQERGVRLGDEVGYQIRLDKVCSIKTRIRFVTEGVLLRQMLSDPALRGVSEIGRAHV